MRGEIAEAEEARYSEITEHISDLNDKILLHYSCSEGDRLRWGSIEFPHFVANALKSLSGGDNNYTLTWSNLPLHVFVKWL